jgi:hypothetical protein
MCAFIYTHACYVSPFTQFEHGLVVRIQGYEPSDVPYLVNNPQELHSLLLLERTAVKKKLD